jgi:hypothetical protein
VIAFALAVLAGFGLLVKTAAGDDRVAYSLGVQPLGVVTEIDPAKRLCQEPIDLPVGAAAVAFSVNTDTGAGEPLDVTVRAVSGRVLGRGAIAAGHFEGTPETARLDRVAGPADGAAVCIANQGDQPVAVFGSENVQFSHTTVDGAENPVDLDLRFLYDEPRPFLGQIPDAFERAALFRPGWFGAWVYWVLLAVLAIGAPLLLGFGLWRAVREDERDDEAASVRHPLAASAPPLEAPAGDRLQ